MRLSILLLSSLLPIVLVAAEPSVFGAGDLNSPNPYGLTHEEKLILENKKELQSVVQKHNVQKAKVETVTERIDGLQSIIEGLSQAHSEQKSALQKLADTLSDNNSSTAIEELNKQVGANSVNIAQLKTLIEELSRSVDGINATYVTKEQFATLIKQLKLNPPVTAAVVIPAKLDNSGIEKEAYTLFEQKKYAEAQTYFEQMIQKKYKVPESLYMIGETLFERKEYKAAINYYKDSASRNAKVVYMPTLLLHSGISMEKTGDVGMAKGFYQATISKYSGSGAAKEANERLSKLK